MRVLSVLFLLGGTAALTVGCGASGSTSDGGQDGAVDGGGDAGMDGGADAGTDGGTDPCESVTCMNGGVCEVVLALGVCDCDGTGYDGDQCENDVDECPNPTLGPCDAVGTASCDGTTPAGSYTCTCNTGYAGMDCDECDDGFEMSEGMCVCADADVSASFGNLGLTGATQYDDANAGVRVTPGNAATGLNSPSLGTTMGASPRDVDSTMSDNESVVFEVFRVDGGVLTSEKMDATGITVDLEVTRTLAALRISAEDKEGTVHATDFAYNITESLPFPKTASLNMDTILFDGGSMPIHKLTIRAIQNHDQGVALESIGFNHECLGFTP